MTPLVFVGAALMLAATRPRRKRSAGGTAAPKERPEGLGRTRPTYRRPNGPLRQRWTSFPWQPDRASEIAAELIDKGEKDPERLTLATAKTIYPVHPITGQPFDWNAEMSKDRRDPGVELVWRRIRLRINTLIAADEERVADEATALAQPNSASAPTPAPDLEEPEPDEGLGDDAIEGEPETDEEAETESNAGADEEDGVTSPVIARYVPPHSVETFAPPPRRPLTLSRRAMRQRRRIDLHALHPSDNRLGDGVFHTVADGETIHAIARGALEAKVSAPTDDQVAQYLSLIVCSPYNGIGVTWDDEHDVPGAVPYPWGTSRPTLWLPKLSQEALADGVVTTLGVTWSDGSNGITPPPEMKPRS